MLELRLVQGSVLKKVLDAVKDLITEANFDFSETDFTLHAMDCSHVVLVALRIRAEGFEHYRCDRNQTMGINLTSLWKILKCARNDDVVTMRADDEGDVLTFIFEGRNQEKVSDFQLKLMDIDGEQFGFPDTAYEATVTMPSKEFVRICRNLSSIGETVTICVTDAEVKFTATGDAGTVNVTCRQNNRVTRRDEQVIIELMDEPISMVFALRYLMSFTKATTLSNKVRVSMSTELPIEVEYAIANVGYVRFYLAPKIEDEPREAPPDLSPSPPNVEENPICSESEYSDPSFSESPGSGSMNGTQ